MLIRSILAPIAGLAVAFVIVLAVETAGHLLFPPPAALDLSSPATLDGVISQLPVGALVLVMIAWMAGAFGGGLVATLIAQRPWAAWLIGVVMLVAGLWSMIVIPHPLWMQIALAPATLAPAGIAGHLGMTRRRGALPDRAR